MNKRKENLSVTIKEVAKKAGVSIATVSYVLGGTKKLSSETIARVHEAANSLGYVPNRLARSLKKRASYIIGVLVPDIRNPFFPSIMEGVSRVLSEEGYEIFEKAKAKVSGLAKRARYVLSHATGKLEVVGLTEDHIFFKYHRAAKSRDSGAFLKYERNPEGYWLDDYDEALGEFPVFSKAELLRRDAAYARV